MSADRDPVFRLTDAETEGIVDDSDRDAVAEVLAAHDWFTPRGYAWPCCPCGVEFPSNDEADCYAHVADALAGVIAAKQAEALREAASRWRPFIADQRCPTCQMGSRETSGMVCQTCGADYARAER